MQLTWRPTLLTWTKVLSLKILLIQKVHAGDLAEDLLA
jgi:hypothetical protein